MANLKINTQENLTGQFIPVTVRILDAFDISSIRKGVNYDIWTDMINSSGGRLKAASRVDCNISFRLKANGNEGVIQPTKPNINDRSYPTTYDTFLGTPTVGTESTPDEEQYTPMEWEECYPTDPWRPDDCYWNYMSVPLYRNGVLQHKFMFSAYDEEGLRHYSLYNNLGEYWITDLNGNYLANGSIYFDIRAYEYVYDPQPSVDSSFTITPRFDVDKFTLYRKYAYSYGDSSHHDRTFCCYGRYASTSQTFAYSSPLLDCGYLYAIQKTKENKPSQIFSILNTDWSSGILLNYESTVLEDSKKPTHFTLEEYSIDITVKNESGVFVKADRLYPNTTEYHNLDSNGNIIGTRNHPYVYLKIFDNTNTEVSSFPAKREFNNIDKYDKVFYPKGSFYFTQQPNGYTIEVFVRAKGKLHNSGYTTPTITFTTKAETLVKIISGNTTNSWRKPSDKHFAFAPLITKDYAMVFNTNKLAETEIMVQSSTQMIYETYHGNMSRKPLIDMVSMLHGYPGTYYVHGKQRDRKYCQFAKTLFHS